MCLLKNTVDANRILEISRRAAGCCSSRKVRDQQSKRFCETATPFPSPIKQCCHRHSPPPSWTNSATTCPFDQSPSFYSRTVRPLENVAPDVTVAAAALANPQQIRQHQLSSAATATAQKGTSGKSRFRASPEAQNRTFKRERCFLFLFFQQVFLKTNLAAIRSPESRNDCS